MDYEILGGVTGSPTLSYDRQSENHKNGFRIESGMTKTLKCTVLLIVKQAVPPE
jgi:hypothetical protein